MNATSGAKSAVRQAASWLWHLSGAGLRRLRGKSIILTYHRVLPESALAADLLQPGMYVRENVFDTHMRFLREHFKVLSIAELLRLWDTGTYDPGRRYAVVTFDDGWADNYRYAFPILRRLGVPATVFLATDLIGTERWFWPERLARVVAGEGAALAGAARRQRSALVDRLEQEVCALKALPEPEVEASIEARRRAAGIAPPSERALLDWREVEEMSAEGISFGSHSCSHRILTRLPADELERELADSLRALNRPGVNAVPVFAYPNGDWNAAVATRARAAGYAAAVSSRTGWEGAEPSDRFVLRRIGIHDDITATRSLYGARISGLDPSAAGSLWGAGAGRPWS